MEMVPYRRMPGRWPWRRRRMVTVPAVRLVLPGPERGEQVPGGRMPALPPGWAPVASHPGAVGADELRVRACLRVALGVVL